MARFIGKRILLSLITLFLLSLIVFIGAQVLPGDVGRSILGPLADQRAVDALNERLGANEPLISQYFDWIGGLFTGDMGTSLAFRRPISDVLGDALVNSLKLAIIAFVIVVPLSILGGRLRGAQRGLQARPLHLARRPLGDRGARLRLGRAADPGLQPPAPDLPRHRDRAAGVELLRPGLLPDPPRVLPRLRAVRLHRPDGARRDDRGARRRLHADGDHQGPAAPDGRARPRAAQLAAADDRGGRHPGGLPARRPARDRDRSSTTRGSARRSTAPRPRRTSRCSRRGCWSWASSTSSRR